jgi:DivIVA domain-containing protein
MLTPQDIHDKVFDRAVISGYVTADVDAFLEEVETDFSILYRENSTLKSKNRALMKMVEEYRATEDAMRMAFASTKKTNEGLINETKERCEKLTRETEEKCAAMIRAAEERRDNIKKDTEERYRALADTANAEFKSRAEELNAKLRELERHVGIEERRLAAACADTDRYIAAIRRLTERQEEYLTGLREMTDAVRPKNMPKPQPSQSKKKEEIQIEPDLDSLDDTDTATAEEINETVERVMSDMKPDSEDEPTVGEPTTPVSDRKLGKKRIRNKAEQI